MFESTKKHELPPVSDLNTVVVYSQLITDSITFLLTCVTLVYITRQHARSGQTDFSCRIINQLILILVQSILFISKDIGITFFDKDNYMGEPLGSGWDEKARDVAFQCFFLQYLLFVGGYVRIGLVIPFTFCLQSDVVKKQRTFRMRLVTLVEVILTITSSIILGFKLFTVRVLRTTTSVLDVIHLASVSLLMISMSLALHRLRKQQKIISGIFCNEKLMCTHWAAFVAASICDEIAISLNYIIVHNNDTMNGDTQRVM